MSARMLQVLLCALSAGALVTAAVLLRPAEPYTLPQTRAGGPRSDNSRETQRRPLDSLARAAAARGPFRANRMPAAVAYDPDRLAVVGATPQSPSPRPLLSVSGIAWGGGTKPSAVLEGLPGSQGPRVVRVGEVIGGLRVRRIQRDVVVMSGSDTTWALTVKAPWK